MAYDGTPPRLASPQDVGLHFVDAGPPVVLDHYRNGTRVERLTISDRRVGDRLALAVYSLGSAALTARYDRVEYRDAPGGTLLGADDFPDLSAWTLGANGWRFSGDGAYAVASGDNGTAVIFEAMPAGTTFFEMLGCSIEGDPRMGGESWMGFKMYRSAAGAGGSAFNAPPDGFLVILRNNGSSEVNDGSALVVSGGWRVGAVGFG